MIEAIFNGKILDPSEGENKYEDPLTSVVFGRLKYLPPSMFWRILADCFSVLPSESPSTIDTAVMKIISFWPKWPSEEPNKKYVEPDVFLSFSFGGRAKQVDIIIEAKKNDVAGRQKKMQLDNYFKPYAEYRGLEIEFIDCYLLALGGGLKDKTSIFDNFQHRQWFDLFSSCQKLQSECIGYQKIVDDVCKYFDLIGFVPPIDFSSIYEMKISQVDSLFWGEE